MCVHVLPILANNQLAGGSFNLVWASRDDPTWHKTDYSNALTAIIFGTETNNIFNS